MEGIRKIINNLEKENTDFNSSFDKFKKTKKIPPIPNNKLLEVKSQKKLIEELYSKFNMKNNTFTYKFIDDMQNEKLKTINFDRPVFINELSLHIEDFVYSTPMRLKVIFNTIDKEVIILHMIPFDFRGEYIEEVKFFQGQKLSLHKTSSSEKQNYYSVAGNFDNEDFTYSKDEKDYTMGITDEGYIEFDDNHRKDRVVCKYTPSSNEFIKVLNKYITSITLETDYPLKKKAEINLK